MQKFLCGIYNYIEADKSKTAEIICFILFLLLTITLSFFHEPWHDEWQAWGIAQDSLYNILFWIPHFEGHPPLWHLIIKFFSLFNIPAEAQLKIPNLLFINASVWLLLFKSPFPKTIRLILPFTYFIFYQYAVISRPYSVFVFAFFLVALCYKNRNESPLKFISSLALLSLSSAYGMVLSAGIAVVWGIEILKEQSFDLFLKDKRFHSLLYLFVICLVISLIITPTGADTSNSIVMTPFSELFKIEYFLFGIPADATFFNLFNYSNIPVFLYSPFDFIIIFSSIGFLFGLFLNVFSIYIFQKSNNLLMFIIPAFLFMLFSYIVFWWPHHTGLFFIFYIFMFWITMSSNPNFIQGKAKTCLIFLIVWIFAIQLNWSLSSAIKEVKYNYDSCREISKFIKTYHLDRYKIMAYWSEGHFWEDENHNHYIKLDTVLKKYKNKKFHEYTTNCVREQGYPVSVNPYFGKNIFFNFNVDYPDKFYIVRFTPSDDEIRDMMQKWKNNGLPDIIFGTPQIENVYGAEYTLANNYTLLKEFRAGMIFKGLSANSVTRVYIRKDFKKY